MKGWGVRESGRERERRRKRRRRTRRRSGEDDEEEKGEEKRKTAEEEKEGGGREREWEGEKKGEEGKKGRRENEKPSQIFNPNFFKGFYVVPSYSPVNSLHQGSHCRHTIRTIPTNTMIHLRVPGEHSQLSV